jgi:hypothetical protein
MTKPETWKQEGPLGDARWAIDIGPYGNRSVDVSIYENDGRSTGIAWIGAADAPFQLRDFARALDRAAAALEAASLESGPHLVPED